MKKLHDTAKSLMTAAGRAAINFSMHPSSNLFLEQVAGDLFAWTIRPELKGNIWLDLLHY